MASRPLRIAQLANFVGPTSGGMKVAIDQLGQGYALAGAERILVVPGPKDEVTETESGVLVSVRSPKVTATYRMVLRPWRALDVLQRFKPTSVECSDKWTLSPVGHWARRHGVASLLFSHERLDDMLAGWLRSQFGVEAAVGALNRRLAKEFDVVVVTSQYSSAEFANTGANLRLVPLGVDLQTFHPSVGQPQATGPVQLCYVGRMSREKYPQLAVAAAVELHRRGVNFQLQMYGTGPDEQALRDQAGDAPVVFNGFIAGRDEVAKRFAGSHISLSICPTETFGLAVLEALACGTPVVTSDRGGARELVDQTCGQWGSPDAISLADAIEAMIARLQPQLRLAARARAEQFSWQRSVSQMLELHTELALQSTGATERGAR